MKYSGLFQNYKYTINKFFSNEIFYNRKKKYEYFVIRIDSRQMLIIVYVTERSVTYTEI